MVARLTRALVPLGSGLVALVLSHSLVYLVRYGSAYGEGLAHSGHDSAWTLAAWSAAILGGGLALAGLGRLVQLGRAVARRDPGARSEPSAARIEPPGDRTTGRTWLRGWLGSAIRLTAVTAVVLTLQENAEHLAAGLPLQGPAMLFEAQYPFALAIVVTVGLAVSFVVALYRHRRDELLARLRRVPARFATARPSGRPARMRLRPPASILGRLGGLRAPPALLDS